MEDIFKYKDCITPVKKIPSINIYGVDKVGDKVPTFTIAIPTYKRVATLSETLESALSQKDFDDYNVIVVDNNPERGDETEVFMGQYRHHPKVTYYKNTENVGMAGNWNKCALLSSARNMVLVHDDDILSPYVLYTFRVALDHVRNNWAIVKPEFKVFSDIHALEFVKPTTFLLNKIIWGDAMEGCTIGAPSIVLLNTTKIIDVGGYNEEFFPSFDYVMSDLQLMKNTTYRILFAPYLGGYRVGANESLKEDTMDKFFKIRFEIGRAFLKEKGFPDFLIKLIQSYRYKDAVISTLAGYNMTDKYKFKRTKFDFYELPNWLISLFKLLQRIVLKIPHLYNNKKIKL